MPAIIFDLWCLFMRFPLHLLRIVTLPQYWKDETKSIDPSMNGGGIKFLSGSVQDNSLVVTNDFSYNEVDPSISNPFFYSYRLAVLLTIFLYLIVIFKINEYTRQRILNMQDTDSNPLAIDGKLYSASLQGKGHPIYHRGAQRVDISVYADGANDDMIQEWCDKSWVSSQTDISELHGNSIRFKRTPNTAHIAEDFKTTRSAAISLLLWECK